MTFTPTTTLTTATATAGSNLASMPMSQAEWLALDREQLARVVRRQNPNLSVLLSIDGSRRFYLMRTGATKVDRTNFTHYVEFIAGHLSRVVGLLFELGVTQILKPVLLPDQFDRPADYLKLAVAHSEPMFLGEAFRQMYAQHGARARLYGDFDISDQAELVRPDLNALAARLKSATPNAGVSGSEDEDEGGVEVVGSEQEQEASQIVEMPRQPTLWLGYHSLSFSQELIRRTTLTATATAAKEHYELPLGTTQAGDITIPRIPSGYLQSLSFQGEYPHPTRVDLLIGAGWLKVGGILPPWLDEGHTDIYNLGFLTLDLDELTVRRILYDHLYRRNAAGDSDADYTPEDLAALDRFYQHNQGKLIGLGKLVGPGLWYADCPSINIED